MTPWGSWYHLCTLPGISTSWTLNKFQLEQLYPNVIQRVRIVHFGREAYPFDAEALTRDTVFKEMVRTNEAFRAYILNYYIELEQEVRDFIVQIDQYLQKD